MNKTNTALKEKVQLTIEKELEEIRDMNGGKIDPKKVVDYARDPSTSLHDKFQWDDSAAAESYREWQARKIISLVFSVISRDKKGKIHISTDITEVGDRTRTYVSLSNLRGDDGGYMLIGDILGDKELRDQMLEDAKADMIIFRRKYSVLKELSEVFEAMSRV
jgi:hypothetical protein